MALGIFRETCTLVLILVLLELAFIRKERWRATLGGFVKVVVSHACPSVHVTSKSWHTSRRSVNGHDTTS
jgi:hypothetical protein